MDGWSEVLSLGARQGEFRHEALFYADRDEFLAGTGAFIREGLASDEPILVVLNVEKIEALRSELNGDGDRVLFADMGDVGHNPARIIPAWRAFVDQHSRPGSAIRGIGEPIWAERSPAELVECQRHESLLNLAFADAPGFRLLCPYDTGALEPDVLEEARRSHPILTSNGEERESTECRSLDEVAAPFGQRLPEPSSQAQSCVFQAGTLPALRDLVSRRAADAGLTSEMADELVLAVHEVATNSIVHGGGSGGILRIWLEDDALVCEVGDTGLIADPLVGRRRPSRGQAGGYGVWLANQLCDLVQVRTFAGGSAVRLHKRRG